MKLGPVTTLDKKNMVTSKKLTMTLCQQIVTLFVTFPIHGHFGAIRKPNYEAMLCKTFIFVNNNLLSYKN